MKIPPALTHIEGMDIYLIDQILKRRYQSGQVLLDAGAGGGRNLNWFFSSGLDLHACDVEAEREALIRARYPAVDLKWETSDLDNLPYDDQTFDHVICNAVLHFARDHQHFDAMFSELVRVLRNKGSIFIRTCSDIGCEKKWQELGEGQYKLSDGSLRYLIDRERIDKLVAQYDLAHLEAVKSVNVDGLRVMTTLVMVKRS